LNQRKRYSFSLRVQPQTSERARIYEWLKSHDQSKQKELITRAVEAYYRAEAADSEGVSKEDLRKIFYHSKAEVEAFFNSLFIQLFGYEGEVKIQSPPDWSSQEEHDKRKTKAISSRSDDQILSNDEEEDSDDDFFEEDDRFEGNEIADF